MELDDDGQPPEVLYRERVGGRMVSEMIGVCKGLICDGIINDAELAGLKRWMQGNPDALVGYPGEVLANRLVHAFEDGHIDEEERSELLELMRDVTGDTEGMDQPMNLSTRILFDDPVPTILFDNQEYVFTGRMLYGTRKQCEQAVADRGGRCQKHPRYRTNYLVIGPIGSAAWIESTHGTKIRDAYSLKQQGSPLWIVSEENWIQALEM